MSELKNIRKAVFPVAGMGTRFLPATKASPKEMLPIVDKPLIQYAVEEAVAAGIKELIFVTSISKYSIQNHFDSNYELEQKLLAQGKKELLEIVQNILPSDVACIYVRQKEALGIGHAVLCAKPVLNHEPFVLLLADDLYLGKARQTVASMVSLYEQHHASVIAVEKVVEVEKYGVIDGVPINESLFNIEGIVEKPKREEATSDIAVAGRYLLTPEIFEHLENLKPGYGNEIQLTDAIRGLLKQQKVLAYNFAGERYDCGTKLGFLQANIDAALEHPGIKEDITDYLRKRFCVD